MSILSGPLFPCVLSSPPQRVRLSLGSPAVQGRIGPGQSVDSAINMPIHSCHHVGSLKDDSSFPLEPAFPGLVCETWELGLFQAVSFWKIRKFTRNRGGLPGNLDSHGSVLEHKFHY